jgi:hypothetical protein
MASSTSNVTRLFSATEAPSDFWAATANAHEPLWRQMGVDSCRATMFDLHSLQPLTGRWMRDTGNRCGVPEATELDAAFQGVETIVAQWAEEARSVERPLLAQMLSPRRWVYLWRVDGHTGLLAQVHFLNSRSSSHEFDTSGVQLLCEHWLSGERQARRQAMESATALPWNRVERRNGRAGAPVPWALLACGLAALLVAAWLVLGAAGTAADLQAAHQREQARLTGVADGMAVRSLSHALSGGDYGEVQEVLSMKAASGHFADAAVTNARGLVVAVVGSPAGMRIGTAVPADALSASRVLPLSSGSNRIGDLLVARPPAAAASSPDLATGLRIAGIALILALTGLAALVWRRTRRR